MINQKESAEQMTQLDVMRHRSIELFRTSFSKGLHYPNYPTHRLSQPEGSLDLPDGAWSTLQKELPTTEQSATFADNGLQTDSLGRPLHPWLNDMITDNGVGVVTGRGFYWNWGPNYTADPIIVRRDQNEPHILLITRSDTGQWALPGGFVDNNETAFAAAVREASEETKLFIPYLQPRVKEVYCGPLADLRSTAHAWAETTAFCFEIPEGYAKHLPLDPWDGGDDAKQAAWVPLSLTNTVLFGSHQVLIDMALRNT